MSSLALHVSTGADKPRGGVPSVESGPWLEVTENRRADPRGPNDGRYRTSPAAAAQRLPDPTLVALLAKAHEWFGQLTSGRSPCIAAIAQSQQVTSSYVTRVVQLAFLAPDIVQSIARGEHPPHLNARRMLHEVPLPIDWSQQRLLLGFDP